MTEGPPALILCESSGKVREAMRRRGVDAVSCDLLPADDGSPHHLQMDMRQAVGLHRGGRPWAFIGAHLPCTFVCGSGIHWNNRGRGWDKTEAALEDVRWFLAIDVRGYLENPVGIISTRVREPDQVIQPHRFGDDASKATCLWLKRLPVLMPTHVEQDFFAAEPPAPRMVDGRPRYANQTDGGQNRLGPSEDRWKERSQTYPGIAAAMADQWAHLIA